jgi:AbrB family transcriptional regulator (stage V sporulation protein T)
VKATGIVRRFDELGRIVIPKEIRKQFHIHEGDQIEIFTDIDERIILQKYDILDCFKNCAEDCARTIYENTGHIVVVCDKETIVAVCGTILKQEYQDKLIHNDLYTAIQSCDRILSTSAKRDKMPGITYDDILRYSAQLIVPIATTNGPIGAVVLLATEKGKPISEIDIKVVVAISNFFGRQLE